MIFDFSSSVPTGVTVARSGNTATRINASGKIALVNADLGRIDYDPGALFARGLLIEESRTNGVKWSEALDHGSGGFAPWGFDNISIAADYTSAPDTQMTADKVVENSSNATHSIEQVFAKAASVLRYTYSVFAKPAGRNSISLNCNSGAQANQASCTYRISDGTITSAASVSGAWTLPAGSIETYPGGWYKCSVSFTSTTETSINLDAYLDLNGVYLGNGSSGAYLWGYQIDAGPAGDSYIPTTSAAVTRNADDVTIATSAITNWSTTAGDLHVWGRTGPITTQQQQTILTIDDASVVNRISTYRGTDQHVHVLFVAASSTQADLDLGAVAANTDFDIYASWVANAFSAQLNSGTAVTDSAGTVPTGLTTVRVGKAFSGEYLNGWVNKLEFALTTQPTVVVTDAPTATISEASTLVPYLLLQPDGDLSAGSWTTELDATSNLYQSIDEFTASDSDFIQSESFPASSAVSFSLTDPTLPIGTGAGVVRVRYYKESAEVVNLTVRLMEGVTTIKSWTYTNIDFDVLQVDEVLTAGEVATIVDRTNLSLQYEASWTP